MGAYNIFEEMKIFSEMTAKIGQVVFWILAREALLIVQVAVAKDV